MSGDEATVTAVWTYTGRARLTGGKIGHGWLDEATGNSRYFGKPLVPASVGGRYEFTLAADNQVYTGGERAPRYLGRSDSQEVTVWAARDLALGTEQARKALSTKAAKVQPLEDLLDPIIALAERLTTAERRALAAKILQVLL